MSLKVMVWVLEESEATLGARLVLLALADNAHDDGSKAFPSVPTLAMKARMSERGTQDALRRLEKDGMIIHTGDTRKGTRIYTVVCPFNDEEPQEAHSAPRSIQRPGGADPSQEELLPSSPEPSVDLEPRTEPPRSLTRTRVREVWEAQPALQRTKDTTWKSLTTQRLIDKAVAVHGVDDVCRAIENYGKVLASKDHWWNHSWNPKDFLGRGLDRFVPEAKPFDVFRTENERTIGAHAKAKTTYAGDLSRFDD